METSLLKYIMVKEGSFLLGRNKNQKRKGGGLIDKLVDNLPIELHIAWYNYCGPGTKLAERLAQKDKPIYKTDELCQKHDKL